VQESTGNLDRQRQPFKLLHKGQTALWIRGYYLRRQDLKQIKGIGVFKYVQAVNIAYIASQGSGY
jgi:hypothetical protein